MDLLLTSKHLFIPGSDSGIGYAFAYPARMCELSHTFIVTRVLLPRALKSANLYHDVALIMSY